MQKVFITGAAHGVGRLLAQRLAGRADVTGVDSVSWPGHAGAIRFEQVDLGRRRIEEIVREVQPDTILHCGLSHDFLMRDVQRYDCNLLGTHQLLDLAEDLEVERVLVLSSALVYGAFADSALALDETALRLASRNRPALRDLVEADYLAEAFCWRVPNIRTCVLRPAHVLGPTSEDPLAQYLRLPTILTVIGFDPMLQCIHEDDLVEAVLQAFDKNLHGVFNLAGPGEVSLQTMIREIGSPQLALPEAMLRLTLPRVGVLARADFIFPTAWIDFLKFSVRVSGERFTAATGFRCLYELEEIFHSVVRR